MWVLRLGDDDTIFLDIKVVGEGVYLIGSIINLVWGNRREIEDIILDFMIYNLFG